jgi:hypothetical protein
MASSALYGKKNVKKNKINILFHDMHLELWLLLAN